MADPTDLEQFYLELINETRLDPLGNTARYISSYSPLLSSDPQIQSALNFFGVSGESLYTALLGLPSVAPVAWNGKLTDAARAHNQAMIAADSQSHQLPGEAGLGARATNAGYTGWFGLGENVYAYAESVLYGHAGFMVDWGFGPGGMQSPAGHRLNIMDADWTEVGIGVTLESSSTTTVGPQVVTQDFGTRGKAFLLGVAYADGDGDHFYTPGEGVAGLSVQIGGNTVQSTSSGGYTFEITDPNDVTITFSGAGLAAPASAIIADFSENVKADVVNGDTLRISGSALVDGFANITVISLAGLTISAGEGSQRIYGNAGDDTLDGGGNVDTAVLSGARSAYTITQGATGVFTVAGPDGTDTLTNIEYAQFDDTTLRLLPGNGVSVNLAADPATYMGAIRDFDGNALGGNGNWRLIGSADVNGDGDTDHILVNRAIGRFAEVAMAADGKIYFSDHGWAGETRVVGIYIDPLVASGAVAAGSDHDSQRRFQNDLLIENITEVLGADDYDGDGLQEIYFALTDGTAYLHAYMHADGNIRYANYQSEAQVIAFLESHGFGTQTYGDWFA
jgi:Cysteine-rich secretory protein family